LQLEQAGNAPLAVDLDQDPLAVLVEIASAQRANPGFCVTLDGYFVVISAVVDISGSYVWQVEEV